MVFVVMDYSDFDIEMQELIDEMIISDGTDEVWAANPLNEDDVVQYYLENTLFEDYYQQHYGLNPRRDESTPSREELLRFMIQMLQGEFEKVEDEIEDNINYAEKFIDKCFRESDQRFHQKMRIGKEEFQAWFKEVNTFNDESAEEYGDPLFLETTTVTLRVAIAIQLHILSGLSQFVVAAIFQLSQATVQRAFSSICDLVYLMKPLWVYMPHRDTPPNSILDDPDLYFLGDTWAFIDNTHVKHWTRYVGPTGRDRYYCGRKVAHTTSVLCVCDLNGFVTECLGFRGRMGDQTCLDQVVRMGNFLHKIPTGKFLVSDAGYPLMSWLVPTYMKSARSIDGVPTKEQMEEFNRRLSSIRVLIERTFGMVKQKFRLLLRGNDYPEYRQNVMITCAVIIHNFLLVLHNDELEPVAWSDDDEPNEDGFTASEQAVLDFEIERPRTPIVRGKKRHEIMLRMIEFDKQLQAEADDSQQVSSDAIQESSESDEMSSDLQHSSSQIFSQQSSSQVEEYPSE